MNYCPERYGKFQSEISSTSGAICEKPQGGLCPPPAGRGFKQKMRPAISEIWKRGAHVRTCSYTPPIICSKRITKSFRSRSRPVFLRLRLWLRLRLRLRANRFGGSGSGSGSGGSGSGSGSASLVSTLIHLLST